MGFEGRGEERRREDRKEVVVFLRTVGFYYCCELSGAVSLKAGCRVTS
jgi:hypothetical protein